MKEWGTWTTSFHLQVRALTTLPTSILMPVSGFNASVAMQTRPTSSDSCLFTLRHWSEPQADGGMTWRGEVTYVLSGETRYFREWQALLDFLAAACESASAEPPAKTLFPRLILRAYLQSDHKYARRERSWRTFAQQPPYQCRIDSKKIPARSSSLQGRGDSLASRCCWSAPVTICGMSAAV
jgi:hypothetical protein